MALYKVVTEKFSQSTTALAETKSSKDTISNYDDDPDILCGFGSWTPRWLQKAAEPKLFLIFYSMTTIARRSIFSYFVGCMSTLEKRFAYDTKNSGLVLMVAHISPILLGVLVGYFGGLVNRPRLISFGNLIASISSFVFALPYFLYGSGRFDENLQVATTRVTGVNAQICDSNFNENVTNAHCTELATSNVATFFFIASFLQGLSGVILYTTGMSYMDDSSQKKNSSMYFGTFFAVRILGPIIGFLLSSLCLQFYEDPFYEPGFDAQDPRWIGAWWLGFVILGVLIFIFSMPIILFPKRFPQKKIAPTLPEEKSAVKPNSLIKQFKDMGKAVKRLVTNPILMCSCLGTVFRVIGIHGYSMLLPKYTEQQFRQSASKASLYSGPADTIGMQIGILLGGIYIRKFRPGPRVLTGCNVIAESFAIITLISCMLITCPSDQLTGTSMGVNNSHPNLQNECNMDCKCTTEIYTPVCGPGGKSTYFSPCFAGCTGYNKTAEKEVFTNCKCFKNGAEQFTVGDAVNGYCGFECHWIIIFMVILSIGKLLSSTAHVGYSVINLRCVDPEDKSIALGMLSAICSLLAYLPSPLIYGALTDASCLVWEENCGKTGNCWVYDTNKFRYLLHGVSIAFVTAGCAADAVVWILSPRLQNLYDDDEEKEEEKTVVAAAGIINSGGMPGVINTGMINDSMISLNEIRASQN